MIEEQKTSSQQGSPFEIITTSKPKKFNPKNAVIVAIALVFLGISIFLGVYLVGQRTNVEQKASPATSIFISPNNLTKNAGENFTFSVQIDTATNVVTGVDVRLVFDPSVMQIISLQQGAGVTGLDQTISNTYDNVGGTVSYAVFTLNGSNAVTGSGIEVLKVTAVVKGSAVAGSYNISFDSATAASASQEGQNVLISKNPGTLVIGGITSSASPSPTASPAGTGSGAPTSSPNATHSPTPAASGQVNACGGTCGSNNNCQSNLMCYQGVCRNPSCPSNSTCGCATASPTPKSTATASSSSTTPPRTPQSSPLDIPVTGTDWPTVLGVGVGLFVVIASIALAI